MKLPMSRVRLKMAVTGRDKVGPILFIQHASSLGGSNMSLMVTLQGLQHTKYSFAVGLVFPSGPLRNFYEAAGYPVLDVHGVSVFRHTTASWGRLTKLRSVLELCRNVRNWKNSGSAAVVLYQNEQPLLVHLNSVILAPVAARFLKEDIPFVWHVREYPVRGYFGFRFRMLRNLLRKAGNRVIFLSHAEKKAWVDNTNGHVIHNFVDFEKFKPLHENAEASTADVSCKVPAILYLGGFQEIKGIYVLIEALAILKQRGLNFRCLCPGTLIDYNARLGRGQILLRTLLGYCGLKTVVDRCNRMIEKFRLDDQIERMPFCRDVPALMRRADCLVFPSVEPHFARPVIEAQAMGLPVVASRLDGVTELVQGTRWGQLVAPGDACSLAKAIEKSFSLSEVDPGGGAIDRRSAFEKFSCDVQIRKIEQVYQEVTGSCNEH